MLYIDYKRKYRMKGILRLALILVLILVQGILFFDLWINYYNKLLRMSYIMKGNYFLAIVYMILLYAFMLIYDCNRIDENRITTTIFSEFLAIISCNVLCYFVIIIPATALGLMPFTPIVILSVKNLIIIIIWAILSKIIFKKLYPPTPMLLISNEVNLEIALNKFEKRKDIYQIIDYIVFDKPFNEIKDKCNKYSNVVVGDIPAEIRNDIVKYCFENGINTYILPKISDIIIRSGNEVFTFDSPIYYCKNYGLSIENEVIKRIFDIIFSIVFLIITFPLFLIISILIKIEDFGPVFFMQERVTRDEKIFKIIKFRSMKVQKENDIVKPTEKDDERITKIGKIIRRLHFDEIPQFINVLIGDMSVVGPRPERIEHVKIYNDEIPEFSYRHKVKAGITGLAQIYGKYNTTAYDKLKLDLMYIKNYSMKFDIELILRTLKIFFMKEASEEFTKKQSNDITKKCED